MDDVVNRMAKELSDAIAAAVAEDARVEACRERARAAGFEMRVSLEAVIGFVNRTQPALARDVAPPLALPARSAASSRVSANDKRFLRSLRIASDETARRKSSSGPSVERHGTSPPCVGNPFLEPGLRWALGDGLAAALRPPRDRPGNSAGSASTRSSSS